MARKPFSALALSLFLLSGAPVLFAAEANFYVLNEQWSKQAKSSKGGKDGAVDDGFRSAFEGGALAPSGAPLPPVLRGTLDQALQAPTEIQLGQTLVLEGIPGLIKFVAADEGIVALESLDGRTLHITGTTVGRTYIHIWSERGRSTIAIRVIQSKLMISKEQLRQREAVEKNRAFKIRYDNGRSAYYTGPKFRDMSRSSVDFFQNVRVDGDTPYGALEGNVQTQKDGTRQVLSEAHVTLWDGRIGPLHNFNATAGDKRIEPDLMVFPAVRIRGAEAEVWDDKKRAEWTGFYGRENTSLFGTITPGTLSERTRDSFLSGNTVDYKFNDDAKLRAGFFTGSGRSRPDALNQIGMGAHSEVNLGPRVVMENETDFDDEKWANRHSFTTKFEKLRVRNEFRDISKRFTTLVGAPAQQGELGYQLNVSATPTPKWAMDGRFDLFRDRLIPNPEDPDRPNRHTDIEVNHFYCDEVTYGFTYQDWDDTGRLGPTRLRNIGLQYSERFDLWGRNATVFTRYNNRTSEFLTNSFSNFRQNQVLAGIHTPLFWGINFSLQKEWNVVEELELGRTTYPSAVVYMFDTNRQIGRTPFFTELRLRFRDEEETESPNSFMAGEDSAEFSGGLFYREYEDLEIFLTGSLTQYVPESLSVAEPRAEAQFFAGMRGSFDTGVRWDTTGSFEGTVFKDINADGIRQDNEPGIPDQIVRASDGKEAVTDAEGRYALPQVSGKKVTLTLEGSKIPYGFVPTNASVQEFMIQQGKTQTGDFGLTPRSDVTGIVFNDLNASGKYENGEPPVPGVLLTLEDGRTARTNSSGVYTFSNVIAGDHAIVLAVAKLPEGYLPFQSPKRNFSLFEGVRYELHFPLISQRAVTGRVFADANGNGRFDALERPLAGVRVTLGTKTTETDRDGWYLFDEIEPGVYELRAEGARPVKVEFSSQPKTVSDLDLAVSGGADQSAVRL